MTFKQFAAVTALCVLTSACGTGTERIDWSSVRESADRQTTSDLMVGVWKTDEAPYEISLDGNRRYEVCQVARGAADICNTGFVEYRAGFGVILLGFQDTDVGYHLMDITNAFETDRAVMDRNGNEIPEGAYDFSPNVTGAANPDCTYNPCSRLGSSPSMLFRLDDANTFNEDLSAGNWLSDHQ